VNLDLPLRDLALIPPQRVRQLERFGLNTVEDLLTHFPKRYEDRRQFDRFPTHESDKAVCVCGIVRKAGGKRLRGRLKIFEATLEEESSHALSSPVICRWFNQYWVEKVIAVGQRLVVYAKPKQRGSQILLDHPEFEVVEDDAEVSLHLRRITPVHRATEGLSARVMRKIIWDLLQKINPESTPNLLPKSLDSNVRGEMLRQIHFPESWETLEKARTHLVLTEFFGLQLSLAMKRAEQAAQPGQVHAAGGELLRRLHEALPYPLTGAQQRAIGEIRRDLESEHPMNRLLHGDVGAGKTIVALSAMLLAVEAGFQAALMAPTQILAEQHYLNFRRLLEPLGINLALRTGSRKEDTSLPLFDAAGSRFADRSHGPQIIVGTHALLYEGAGLTNLGLAVIDEQHKFGVLQRARLREQAGAAAPDVLVMTATPIPRTLSMTVYGDLDVSVLDELPRNRGKIITAARSSTKINDAAKFLREQLEKGRQAYIVYPLIDESEKLEAKAAVAEYQKWCELLAPMRCELLHGRLPPEEKQAIMDRFNRGEAKALIATTVIEVGIDVPNANLMLIEDAERFGLAQLHQLRGRVGRGEHKSYCILLTGSEDPAALEKLRLLEQTQNGFEIAEADLKIRGPGDLLGTAQTGLPPLKLGDLIADADLMRQARGAAFVLLERDPRLEHPENQPYRKLLAAQAKMVLAQVS
jgi:ATP-dependent DNA helicase RecG